MIRPALACPDENALGAFVTGGASAARRAEIEAHLDQCADCASVVNLLGEAFISRAQRVDAGADSVAQRASASGSATSGGDLPLRTLGRYEVEHGIGAGGMGLVFSAWDPTLKRRVAVKLLRPELGATEQARDRLLAEARSVASLKHPNVISVFDVGEQAGRVFIAMELVDGLTLDAWRESVRPSLEQLLEVFLQAGRGLWAAHRGGLVHRDFKPQNVLVTSDQRVLVSDFGLAVSVQAGDAPEVAGTPAYMAPEQFHGNASAASDQYSFALCLYEALYAELPRAPIEVAPQPEVPDWLRPVLQRALSPDPTQRYADLGALLRELEGAPSASASAHITANSILLCAWSALHAGWFVVLVYAVHLLVANPRLIDPDGNLFGTDSSELAPGVYPHGSAAEGGLLSAPAGDPAIDDGDGEATDDELENANPPEPTSAADTPLTLEDWVVLLGAIYALAWIPLGLFWAPLNAFGLWRRRSWARASTLAYAGFTGLSVIGLPYALYAGYSLTRPQVAKLFHAGSRQRRAEAVDSSVAQGELHLNINTYAQAGMWLFHVVLLLLCLDLIRFGQGATPGGILLGAAWHAMGSLWTPINAYALARRRPWARASLLAYAALSLWTCVGTPYAVYALFSLNKPSVRARLAD